MIRRNVSPTPIGLMPVTYQGQSIYWIREPEFVSSLQESLKENNKYQQQHHTNVYYKSHNDTIYPANVVLLFIIISTLTCEGERERKETKTKQKKQEAKQ